AHDREVRVGDPREPRRRHSRGEDLEVRDRLAGVHEPGLEADAWIGIGLGLRRRLGGAAGGNDRCGGETNATKYKRHHGLLGAGGGLEPNANNISSMRLISVFWSTWTSDANLKTVSSCPAPCAAKSSFIIDTAPLWCWIMKVRKRRSKSSPRAASSSFICASVSIPGMSITCCSAPIVIVMPSGFGCGTGCRRALSQLDIKVISSVWALITRSVSRITAGLAPW